MIERRHNRCPGRQFPTTNRRDFLRRAGAGFGLTALAALLAEQAAADSPPAADPLTPRPPHFPPRAKSVIWLFMEGGPSGFDLFDPKPELQQRHGQRVAGIQTHFGNPGPLLRSPYSFRRYGQSGAWVCEKYATLAQHVDDIAFVKSMVTESANHAPAMYQMNTGVSRPGLPSAGAWVSYGLGSESRNLPGFLVMAPGVGKGGPANWGAGFLPGSYQGTLLRSGGQPILHLGRPGNVSREEQRGMLDLARDFNSAHARQRSGEEDLLARIESFELAYRMQMEAPDAIDLSKETAQTKRLYGIDRGNTFGTKCLLARRFIERGVRFVQVYSNDEWDAHGSIKDNHDARCAETDVPIAGLLTDLKARGLLDETLVIWGGEFGRMPVSEGGQGRDHNPHGFLVWLAGAGVKGGTSYGETDEIGYKAAVNPVTVHDLHATMLHLLGLDHKRLTYSHNGRRFRLTDVAGQVLHEILT
jgi:hypothetical protein